MMPTNRTAMWHRFVCARCWHGYAEYFGNTYGKKPRNSSNAQNRPLSALGNGKRTNGLSIGKCLRSSRTSQRRWRTDRLSARKDFNDDHCRTTVRTDEAWLNRSS